MIGPPFLKLSTKKFLSNAPSGTGAAVGDPLGEGDAPVVVVAVVVAGDIAVVVVVAGDMAEVAGVVPGIGEMPGAVAAGATALVVAGDIAGTAGVVAGITGAVAAGLVAGGAPGGRLTGEAFGGGGG
jgi:hypothetical protein